MVIVMILVTVWVLKAVLASPPRKKFSRRGKSSGSGEGWWDKG